MSKRKRYSPEYKRELVELVRRSQSSCRQIALEVGVNPNMLTRSQPGDLFILRNPGNIVPAYYPISNSEDATIEFAVEILRVPHIIVCGHSDCGAIKALLRREDMANLPSVTSWLQHAESTLRVVRASCEGMSEAETIDFAIERHVLVQIDNLRTHPAVASHLATGELELHGWVYDLRHGLLTDLEIDPADEPARGIYELDGL